MRKIGKIGIDFVPATPCQYVIDEVTSMTYNNLSLAADLDCCAAIDYARRGDRRWAEYYARRGEHRYRTINTLWSEDYRISHYRDYLDWKWEVMNGRAGLER